MNCSLPPFVKSKTVFKCVVSERIVYPHSALFEVRFMTPSELDALTDVLSERVALRKLRREPAVAPRRVVRTLHPIRDELARKTPDFGAHCTIMN